MKHPGQEHVDVVPLTLPKANAFIEAFHRHHGKLPGGFAWWAVGAIVQRRLVGAALAGRPTNRNNDDGQTVEVQRLASDGTPNVCSALYGACVRAARAIGARRILTYTLETEGGASLRGAGWVREADGIQSWWTHAGTRTAAVDRPHMQIRKVRWALDLKPRVVYGAQEDATTMSNLPFLEVIHANIKGGVDATLGPKTLVVGPCRSGKSAHVAAVELLIEGGASDLGWRPWVKDPAMLREYLVDGESSIMARGRASSGGACHFMSSAGVRTDHLSAGFIHAYRVVKEALTGDPDKAYRFLLRHTNVVDQVGKALEAGLSPRARVLAQALLPLDLALAPQEAKRRARKAKSEADGAQRVIESIGSVPAVAPNVSALTQRAEGLRTALTNAYRTLAEAQATLDSIPVGPAEAKIAAVGARLDALQLLIDHHAARGLNDCALCGATHPEGALTLRGQQLAALATDWRAGQAAYSADRVRRSQAERWLREETPKIPETERYLATIEEALTNAQQTSNAQAQQIVESARANEADLRQTADDWKAVEDVLNATIAKLAASALEALVARCQPYLPAGDSIEITAEPFAIRLLRDGKRYQGLSGAEGVAVLCAVACAVADAPAILIPDERAYDPATLTDLMRALRDAPAQVLLTSTVAPEVEVEGWTVIYTDLGVLVPLAPNESDASPESVKRKRRTKAQMEEARAAAESKAPRPVDRPTARPIFRLE